MMGGIRWQPEAVILEQCETDHSRNAGSECPDAPPECTAVGPGHPQGGSVPELRCPPS